MKRQVQAHWRAMRLWLLVLQVYQAAICSSALSNSAAVKNSSPTTTTSQKQRPIQRVAIIGSGIAGLAVAHALVNSKEGALVRSQTETNSKLPNVVAIFDARPGLDERTGAGIQLNGGLAVLGKINPELQSQVWQAGIPLHTIQSRCKAWFNNNENNKNFSTLIKLDLKKLVQTASDPEIRESLIGPIIHENGKREEDQLLFIAIMRGALQKVLHDALPKSSLQKNTVQFEKKLTRIITNTKNGDQEGGVFCEFTDGSVEGPFDLIVGCDGIKSVVKEYVERGDSQSPLLEQPSTRKDILYSGLRIRFAVAAEEGNSKNQFKDDPLAGTLTQMFGDGMYGLYGVYGNGKGQPVARASFLIFLDENYIGPFQTSESKNRNDKIVIGENADWSQDVRQVLEKSRKTMLDQLTYHNIPDRDNNLGSAITDADRTFEMGVYFHNPFSPWSREIKGSNAHVVLCGDSAHAFPPFLGQGSNQAIQDAYCLVDKILEYNRQVEQGDERADLTTALKQYKDIRWPATFGIFWKSIFLGYLETGGSGGIYSKFRDSFFQILGLIGVPARVLFDAAKPKVK